MELSAGSNDDFSEAGSHERHAIATRRLDERDCSHLSAFLEGDPGFAIFLAGNLSLLDRHNTFVRYWGSYAQHRLIATLMMVGKRAALYAPVGVDVSRLAQIALDEGADFTMGRSDLVDAVLALTPSSMRTLREEHYFAELAPEAFRAAPSTERGTVVRRATDADLDALTELYYGSDGFEDLTHDQVRNALATRLRSLRTFVASHDGALVAAASTSSETPTAAMIGGVWTAPEARNRGYSTAIVSALSEELLQEHRRPYLFYLLDNEPAAHVYTRIGFRPIGKWTVAYLERLDRH